MTIQEKLAASKRQAERLCAAEAIFAMDPHAREELITHIKTLNVAEQSGDQEEQQYVLNAILELFDCGEESPSQDISDWFNEIEATEEGKKAAGRLKAETDLFFDAYQRAKNESGLKTVREIAAAAGLSPTTVQAIESERVKPQAKTVAAIAKAFGKDVSFFQGRKRAA